MKKVTLTDSGLKILDTHKQTVFDHITQSVEELAEKLVYYEDIMGVIYWFSTVLSRERAFLIKSRAIAATVVELKKEWRDDT